jgi:hypothetical protein
MTCSQHDCAEYKCSWWHHQFYRFLHHRQRWWTFIGTIPFHEMLSYCRIPPSSHITAIYFNVRRCLQTWIRKLMKQKDWGTGWYCHKGSWLNFSHSRHNHHHWHHSLITHYSTHHTTSTELINTIPASFSTILTLIHTHPHVLYTRFALHIITRFRLLSSFVNKGTIVVVSKSWYPASSTIIIHPKNNSL